MNEAKKPDEFIAMKGAGYYSRATIGAKHVMDNATSLILDAVERHPPADDGSAFTVTDMGCADGGTSIDMVGQILHEIRARCPSRPILMVYTDLPRNDFSELFQVIHGLSDTKSYFDDIADLYVMASATSFHNSIVPPNTLSLGHSATASHYIAEIPVQILDHVHMVGSSGATREAFEVQGAIDWENFLLKRTEELSQGGFLALFNFGIDEEGRYLGHTGGKSMFDVFNNIWREMANEGAITEAEYNSTNFPQVYRTVEQFTAPLEDVENPVFKAGLRLEHVETRVVPCPYAEEFKSNNTTPSDFARDYIPTLRSWSEPVFLSGLSTDRDMHERIRIVDNFYGRYQTLVASSPEGHGMDYVHCYMICRKV
jgi:hypothetical protein|tara:strand:+ start:296 stop:1405 length:1110 start_codon:yes stop_codon:yes gene_type:complete